MGAENMNIRPFFQWECIFVRHTLRAYVCIPMWLFTSVQVKRISLDIHWNLAKGYNDTAGTTQVTTQRLRQSYTAQVWRYAQQLSPPTTTLAKK